MEWFIQTLLILGLIFVSAYSLKISEEAIKTMDMQNKQIQMMFVKS
jgi:hypothetical protein